MYNLIMWCHHCHASDLFLGNSVLACVTLEFLEICPFLYHVKDA